MDLSPASIAKKSAKKIYKNQVRPLVNAAFKFDAKHGGRLGKQFFRLFEWAYALAYIPGLREKIPALDPSLSNVSTLPINKDIEGGEGIALPEEVMDRLIDKAGYIVLIKKCACRQIYECKQYPIDIGCIFMGESAKQISSKMGRPVSAKQAKAHIRKGIKAGLVPIVGEARADHDLLRIPFESKLLTTCLCCECCCLSRFLRRGPFDVIDTIMEPVEGISIEVTADCIGCGQCESSCFVKAIKVENGMAVIDKYCRICGRCAGACPQNAIKLKLDNPNAVDDVVNRILSRVDLS